MKKIILLCSFAVLGIITSGTAQNDTKVIASEISETENGAKIEFESEKIDYGIIDHNADGYREFIFTNTGNSPLVITNAKGSCGCTVPTWPREPIAAGESSKIKVKYATNRVGAFSKSITLTSNAINAPKKVIKIKGKVNPDSSTKTENKTEVKS